MNSTDAIKLNDTQMLVLSAAAARVNGSLLPMPEKIRGGASIKVLAALVKKLCAQPVENPDVIGGTDYRITRTGLNAIGADPDEAGYESCSGETEAEDAPAPTTPVKTRAGTKQARLVEMLSAKGGATVETLMAEFGWQRHTVRGAISGAIRKKLGHTVEVIKAENGERHYHIPAT